MGIPRFFKQLEYKQFEYQPLYYNERKERMKERLENAEKQSDVQKKEEYIPNIKGQMRNYYKRSTAGKQKKISNIRLIILIIIFAAIAYYLFYY